MSFVRTLAVVALGLGLALPAAMAADKAAAPAAQLRSLCDGCALVSAVREEQRKGEASGVGAVGGAVLGGLLGNQVGGGTGRTVATAGGAVAGGLAGHEIEKRMKKHSVWVTRVTLKNGQQRQFEQADAPAWRKGDVVRIEGDRLVRK